MLSTSLEIDRRTTLFNLLALSLTSTAVLTSSSTSASEIDASGLLFTPKNEMIKKGGSEAARGIPLKPMEKKGKKGNLLSKSTGLIQNVYETRFVTYLARFLLVFDPAASAWWKKSTKLKDSDESTPDGKSGNPTADVQAERFAEFAESVEIGLADYFLGPYGSYASVAAAKAGLTAAAPAKSARESEDNSIWSSLFGSRNNGRGSTPTPLSPAKRTAKQKELEKAAKKAAKQGILNLFSLLRARYTSIEEKQQLAILFSLISSPELQPVTEIRGLLGEIDNGTIAAVELVDLSDDDEDDKSTARDYFRLSSRQGGGFSKDDAQVIKIDTPAPLGDDYKPAKIRAIMKPTTRILRINVTDGGEGYVVAPDVVIKPKGVARRCEACAIIDRKGSVSEIIVLSPGYGYGGQGLESTIPTVEIKERKSFQKNNPQGKVRPAKAVAELEYKVVGVEILDGGSGYLFDEPPEVSLNLPRVDPDWFVTPTIRGRNTDEDENQLIAATVSMMKSGSSGITVDTSAVRRGQAAVDIGDGIFESIQRNPVSLLPSYIRPQFSKFLPGNSTYVIENGYYVIPSLPTTAASEVALPSSYYRSFDPLFGGIGKTPVTKNAVTLSANQYYRLALSGAICTVLVRTGLNPLELVKTKIQLGNDKEIIELAKRKSEAKELKDSTAENANASKNQKQRRTPQNIEPSAKPKSTIGTVPVIQSLIEVRGPLSLFQSADITFLTSIVFGLFGFGATELFRRSFSAVFFNEATGTDSPNEFVLLAAAAIATLVTCAAGAPFEILRVRSMSSVEALGVKTVFEDFLEEKRSKSQGKGSIPANSVVVTTPASSLSILPTKSFLPGLQLEDIKPLWSSFNPIVSRELPFAVTKFLVFDLAAGAISDIINNSNLLGEGNQVQVGVGTLGLLLSAFSGALAGIAGAFISHPADLILTLTSASSRQEGPSKDWRGIIKELISADGGILNLYSGFPARAVFFFFVIGLQFFLYDFIKTILEVGTDDLTLVLDIFYAIRQGLV